MPLAELATLVVVPGRADKSASGAATAQLAGRGDRLRVVLFEPIPLMAKALCLFLATQPDIDADGVSDVAEFLASVGHAAVSVVCFHTAGPHVASILRAVRARTDAPLVLFGPHDPAGAPAFRVGRGISLREQATPQAFLEAIQSLASDSAGTPTVDTTSGDGPDVAVLTAREQEIVALVAQDLTARQIATLLGVSERTIHAHLRNAYKKLDVHGRVGAVEAARREGLLRRGSVVVADLVDQRPGA